MKIRIKFLKQGSMKFVGHLDMMRYFQKAMRRAQVDIRYSEGFSPHQIMSFAAPLGVGITSNGEYLDIEVLSTDSSKIMVDRLNQAMVEEIRVLSYRRLEDSGKSAMSLVCAADYTLEFREGYIPGDLDGFFRSLQDFYGQDPIMIVKQTKRGHKEMDLKPLIYQLERRGDKIFTRVSTGSTDNIKPELVMETFYQSMGWEYPKFAFQIQREEVYGRDSAGLLVPLEKFGEDIE
ncbi:MAG: DUF2344 domain-containing protein [Hungatella sp.]|nr:DUF2344 domain-containing protein [Hungatella sp.]MCI9503373.1 DUF2344 domain-containing protein [Hungatella sp.]MCI9636034.1 DUF2344 domain-containing protein [Hungatella sp.]